MAMVNRHAGVSAGVVLGCVWVCAGAQEGAGPGRDTVRPALIEARAGFMRSDNLRRAPTDEENGSISSAGFGLDVRRRGRFAFEARGDLDRLEYSDDAFESELAGYFNGRAAYAFVPQRFVWHLRDTYGQLTADPFGASTPDNLDNVNYLTTGPELFLPLPASLRLNLHAAWSDVHHEDTALDSGMLEGGAGLIRDLSSSSQLSFEAAVQRIEFDEEAIAPDYRREQAFGRYEAQGGRSQFSADLGYSRLRGIADEPGDWLARLDFTRQISPASSVSLRAARQFSNAADVLRSRLGWEGVASGAPTLAAGDAFEERTYGVGWFFERGRTRAELVGEHRTEDYERNADASRSVATFALRLQRRVTPRLTLRTSGDFSRERFDVSGFTNEQTRLEGAADLSLSRHFGVTLRYARFEGDATNPLIDYTESRIGASLFYRFTGR